MAAAVANGEAGGRQRQSIIARRENRRQIAVRTNIRGRDQGGFASELQEKFEKTVKLPEGYRVEWGGQFDNLERARINRRLRYDGSTLGESVIARSLAQLRPVLMMIAVAMIGMVPAARATGIGSDVQRPLATVVVGGLASKLFLTFLALPSLCFLLNRGRRESVGTPVA